MTGHAHCPGSVGCLLCEVDEKEKEEEEEGDTVTKTEEDPPHDPNNSPSLNPFGQALRTSFPEAV